LKTVFNACPAIRIAGLKLTKNQAVILKAFPMRKKRFVTICLLLAFCNWALPLYSQTDTVPTFSKDDYLQKSIRQKNAGHLMLGIGGALVLTSFLLPKGKMIYDGVCILGWCQSDRYENDELKAILGLTGVAAGLSSIFFYKASKKNARKATTMGLHMERAVQLSNKSLVQRSFPALRFRWCF
jgi:hypothetical protein